MTDRYAKYTRLKFDRPHPKVLRITLDNGRMNTADAAMHAELGEIWRDVDADPTVNAAIITGAGKHFSAGGDFGMIQTTLTDPEFRARNWKEARDIVYNIINCNKPVVSAMRGVAVGAAMRSQLFSASLVQRIALCAPSASFVATSMDFASRSASSTHSDTRPMRSSSSPKTCSQRSK